MATITKSADAPAGATSFSVGQINFTLDADQPEFVTEDQNVVASARANSFLSVKEDIPVANPNAPTPDQNDPQNNPEADHLSAQASQAAKDAAAANQAAIADIVTGAQNVGAGEPTVAETVASTLDIIGVEAAPVLPVDEAPAPTPSAAATSVPTPVATTTSPSTSSSASSASPTTDPAASASSSSSATPAAATTGSN